MFIMLNRRQKPINKTLIGVSGNLLGHIRNIVFSMFVPVSSMASRPSEGCLFPNVNGGIYDKGPYLGGGK